MFWGLSGTAWTAIYTLLTAGLLVTAIVAALYARRQWLGARAQVDEARKAQLEAIRPYVIVTAPPSATAPHMLFNLSIENVGARPALDVRVRLDPPPRRAEEDEKTVYPMASAKMLNEPISLLAPGQSMTCYYDSVIERKDRDDLPSFHRAYVTYEDFSGNQYQEEMVVDLEALRGNEFIRERTVHDVAEELKQIRNQLKSTSLLARKAHVDVAAVVESHSGRADRVAHQSHLNNIELLRNIQQIAPHDSQAIGVYEKRIADYEATRSSKPTAQRPMVTYRRHQIRRESADQGRWMMAAGSVPVAQELADS